MIVPDSYTSKLPWEAERIFRRYAQYMYDNVEFLRPSSSIHSTSHCERVLYHALRLGSMVFGPTDTDALTALAHAAIFHDTRRMDDFLDTGHGARAAVYYTDFCKQHPEIEFHPETAVMMRYHDQPDEKGVKAICKEFGSDAERVKRLYAIFKDSDALDRRRLGRKGLDPKFLRNPRARTLISEAEKLVEVTTAQQQLMETDRMVSRLMETRKMLMIVDPQNDFIDGSLPVPDAEKAMDALAEYVGASAGIYDHIIVTADRHPAEHCSFKENGGMWPAHCVAGTEGAALRKSLQAALDKLEAGKVTYLYKGNDAEREEYSIFANKASAERISDIICDKGIGLIDICGLAGDICVAATMADGQRLYPEIIFHLLKQYSPVIS